MPEEKRKTWIRKYPVLAGILGFFLFLVIIGICQGISKGMTGDSINEEIQKELLPASYEEVEQKAVSVSYEDLMRYSESYNGEWVCFEGEIVQVVADIPGLELRVSTKEDGWIGYVEDVVYLYSGDYSGERLLEGDLIQFCGKSTGILIYEAVFGNQISIPGIETDEIYVKLIKKAGEEVSEENRLVTTIGQVWISAENWDADSEIDGLEFSLQPTDEKGELVKINGNAEIKLWGLECTERSQYLDMCLKEECTRKDNHLLESWSIPVNLDDYGYSGANVKAEYKNYNPQGDKYDQQGCVEITFTTFDGKSFTSFDDNVFLAGF